MKVLVDTSVWSQALRRKKIDKSNNEVRTLTQLVNDALVVMIGPVRQELLSGISKETAFLKLKSTLDCYDDLPISTQDYETAAEFNNICRRNGIQGSHTDFLICAVAANNNLVIYTLDDDFKLYAQYLPINLLKL